MIQVFHIFKKHARFPKSVYTPETRNSFSKWDNQITSTLGYIHNDQLILSQNERENVNINRTGAIIIQDIYGPSKPVNKSHILREANKKNIPNWFIEQQFKQNPELIYFNRENRVWSFEIFSIERSLSEEFDLFLKYKANELYIGGPSRNDHKLCTLKKGQPVEIYINGKSDFTMTGRKERTYSEYDYIIEYLGEIPNVEFMAPNKIKIEREIPYQTSKVIDLRKALY